MQIINPTQAAMYSSVTNAISRIASTEGVVTLWKGISSVALGAGSSPCRSPLGSLTGADKGVGPAHAVYFATYEAVKAGMGGNEGSGHHPLAAGTGPSSTR